MAKRNALLTAGAIIGGSLGVLSIFNAGVRLQALKARRNHKHIPQVYRWSYGKVHYMCSGSGSPVILLHDLNSCGNRHEWDYVRKTLEKDHTVYIPDLPGCGESIKPNFTYTTYMYVNFLKSFIADVVGENVQIVASGMSCSIALMLGQIGCDYVQGTVLISPPDLRKISEEAVPEAKLLKHILRTPVLGSFIYNLYSYRGTMRNCFDTIHFHDPEKCPKEYLSNCFDSSHGSNTAGRFLDASLIGHDLNCPVRLACANQKVPVTLIGGDDAANSFSILADYHKMLQHSDTVIIENSGDLPHIEQAQATGEILADILW